MSEHFVAYFERLERLSTEDLDRSAVELAGEALRDLP